MERVRFALAYLWSNWRSLALCILITILVLILFQDRNRNRFVPFPDSDAVLVLDTHTGQFCNPYPQGQGRWYLPLCSDLAKSWR
jgi:hypothetical protein